MDGKTIKIKLATRCEICSMCKDIIGLNVKPIGTRCTMYIFCHNNCLLIESVEISVEMKLATWTIIFFVILNKWITRGFGFYLRNCRSFHLIKMFPEYCLLYFVAIKVAEIHWNRFCDENRAIHKVSVK